MTQDSDWVITPLRVDGVRPRIQVTAAGVTFGRDPANSVVLPGDAYPGVSGHHARIVREPGGPVLEDLNSRNGTRVNGAAIDRHVLRHGDTIELGIGGPRFAVVNATGANETIAVTGSMIGRRFVGNETLVALRHKLGLSGEERLDQILERRGRKTVLVIAAVLVVVLALAAAAVWKLREREQERLREREAQITATFKAETDALSKELQEARQAVLDQQNAWRDQQSKLDAAREAWEADKSRLMEERGAIEDRIAAMAKDDESKSEQLENLYQQLAEANQALSRFDPLQLEKMRLDKVSAVEAAVVLVEASLLYVDARSGRTLFMLDDGGGTLTPNFDGRGTRVSNESTGSGFMVGADGYLLTNAHVVHKKHASTTKLRVPNADVVQRLEVRVVFSGTSWRHPAQLVRFAADDDQDLALLKIQPFDGMAYVPAIDLDVGIPPRLTEVYILGFPFGTEALQEGDKVIASTFKGIASRKVGPYLQVDAAVHPGNSGGPLIDGNGRVLGVVTGLQGLEDGRSSSAIGYVIPIAEARAVWPPP